jgi:UDP-N-acetylglucosamine acyltransferase
MNVHKTAIINGNVKLGKNVAVGPYCILDGDIQIGDNTILVANVHIYKWVKIGKNCKIYPFCSIGTEAQDLKYKECISYVEIGNNNTIREFVTINRATELETKTVIGDNNFFMAYAHVAHNCVIMNNTIFANAATLGGHVTVEDYAILGGLVGIHQFCKIGKYAIVGGATPIRKDVVPYSIIKGQPPRTRGINYIGLKRHNFPSDVINNIKKVFNILFFSNLNTTQAVEKIEKEVSQINEIKYLLDFVKNSSRGIIK